MAIRLNGAIKNNGGTVRYNSSRYPKLVRVNGTVGWKAEQSLSDASVTRSDRYTLSSTVWDMSDYTSLSGTFYIHGGYGRWTGDGSASSAYGYAYIQLADGTRVMIPDTEYTLGGGTNSTTEKTATTTIDLSAYTATQRASVRYGIYTIATWSSSTGMYVIGDGTATNVKAS